MEGDGVVHIEDDAPRNIDFEAVALAFASGQGGKRFVREWICMDTGVSIPVNSGDLDNGLLVLGKCGVWGVDETIKIVIVVMEQL